MVVGPKKIKELEKRFVSLDIEEKDLVEKFILASGKGGQKVNKTHCCVYLKHLPSQIEVKCQKSRSREDNRYFARKELCDKLEDQLYKEQSKKKQEIEKIKRQKRKRSKRAQEKILKEKAKVSEKKRLRQFPLDSDNS